MSRDPEIKITLGLGLAPIQLEQRVKVMICTLQFFVTQYKEVDLVVTALNRVSLFCSMKLSPTATSQSH